jgi:hypothetical protein
MDLVYPPKMTAMRAQTVRCYTEKRKRLGQRIASLRESVRGMMQLVAFEAENSGPVISLGILRAVSLRQLREVFRQERFCSASRLHALQSFQGLGSG